MPAEASIGSLVVNVLGNVGGFVRGMKKGEKRLSRFDKQVLASQKRMKNFRRTIVALGTAIGTARLASEFTETARQIDSLAKTSDKLGIATEHLAGLRFAAQQTGVDIRTLDMAIQRMTRRISEAAAGTGEAKNAIAELGLDAQRLNELGPAMAFREIATAMAGVENKSDKLRFAFKLFDSEGAALVNTLQLGRRGLQDMQNQAESLGIAISREEAAKVEEFNDALNSLSNLIGGLKSDIVIRIAPEATAAVKALSELQQGLKLGAGTSAGSFLNRDQWPWTTALIKGFKGEFDWQKRWTDAIIRGDIRQGIAAGSPAIEPSRPRRVTTAHQQQVVDAMIERDRRATTFPEVNRRIASSIGMLFDQDQWRQTVLPVFQEGADLIRKAEEFGSSMQRDLLKKGLFGQGPFGAQAPRDNQTQRNLEDAIVRGFNNPLIEGTVEAFRAEQLERRDARIWKMQLDEQKKHTRLLENIADAEGVQIIEGGL